jgi:DNA-binding transcriptional ArsR family regulator
MAMEPLPVLRQRGTCCALPVDVDEAGTKRGSQLLKALADPTRLTIVSALAAADAPVCICDFTGALELSQPTISHHMGRLRQAGLVDSRKDGLWVYYTLRPENAPAVRAILGALVPASNH